MAVSVLMPHRANWYNNFSILGHSLCLPHNQLENMEDLNAFAVMFQVYGHPLAYMFGGSGIVPRNGLRSFDHHIPLR